MEWGDFPLSLFLLLLGGTSAINTTTTTTVTVTTINHQPSTIYHPPSTIHLGHRQERSRLTKTRGEESSDLSDLPDSLLTSITSPLARDWWPSLCVGRRISCHQVEVFGLLLGEENKERQIPARGTSRRVRFASFWIRDRMTAAAPPAVESCLQAHTVIEIEGLSMAMEGTGISESATNSTGTNCPLKHGAEDRDKLSHSSVERASIRSVIRSVRSWIDWSLLRRAGGTSRPPRPFRPVPRPTGVASRSTPPFFTRRRRRTAAPMATRPSSVTGSSAQSLWWGPSLAKRGRTSESSGCRAPPTSSWIIT